MIRVIVLEKRTGVKKKVILSLFLILYFEVNKILVDTNRLSIGF